MFFLLIFVGIILIPSSALAWGPMTHLYLGSELFAYAPLIPAGIFTLLKKYRQDYLYGNLMADMILGKKYLPDEKSSHCWDVGLKLLGQAKKDPERAFVYGYLSHLAADTVAHEVLTDDLQNVGHTLIELKADSIIKKTYWVQSMTFSRSVQRRNDLFLESALDSFIFSCKTNRRIYKGMVFLTLFNKKRKRGLDRELIKQLHIESIIRTLDLFQNGTDSIVLGRSPL